MERLHEECPLGNLILLQLLVPQGIHRSRRESDRSFILHDVLHCWHGSVPTILACGR